MIKGDYEKLKDLASRNVCSEHRTPLVVAWYGPEKTWVLRCGHDHYPDAITRQLSLTEMHKAGEPLPGYIEDNVKKRMGRQAMEQGKQPTDAKMAMVPQLDLATGQLLLPKEVKSLIDYAEHYDLDPYRGHVVLMYGKPYITIDGYLYHAYRVNLPYTLTSRPLSEVERKPYQLPEGVHAWLAEVIKGYSKSSFTGLGIVTQEEMTAKSPRDASKLRSPVVAAHPWQLAQKRAEWQALRRAFPIGETEEEQKEVSNDRH